MAPVSRVGKKEGGPKSPISQSALGQAHCLCLRASLLRAPCPKNKCETGGLGYCLRQVYLHALRFLELALLGARLLVSPPITAFCACVKVCHNQVQEATFSKNNKTNCINQHVYLGFFKIRHFNFIL